MAVFIFLMKLSLGFPFVYIFKVSESNIYHLSSGFSQFKYGILFTKYINTVHSYNSFQEMIVSISTQHQIFINSAF